MCAMARVRSSAVSRRKPVTPSSDQLGCRAPVGGDHRRSARHRLDHHETERFRPPDREHHHAGATEQVDLLRVRHVLEQLDVVTEQRLDLVVEVRDLRRLAALEDHLQIVAGIACDADRLDRALVGVRPADVDEVVVLVGAVRIGVDVDAVVHDPGVGDVGILLGLRVADRDEMDGIVEERRRASGTRRSTVRATCGRPEVCRRASPHQTECPYCARCSAGTRGRARAARPVDRSHAVVLQRSHTSRSSCAISARRNGRNNTNVKVHVYNGINLADYPYCDKKTTSSST